ncbi:MAG: DUF21 domain-containing protein [Sphingobacterium sp.]|nr:DUF21 domain-containing protein [Sphingobacterium sp.]
MKGEERTWIKDHLILSLFTLHPSRFTFSYLCRLKQHRFTLDSIDSHLLNLFSFILLEVPLSGQSSGIIAGIVAILLLLTGSTIASGAEEAFFSLGAGQINDLRLKNNKVDRVVLQLLEMPRKLVATDHQQLFFNIAIVIISTYLTYRLFDSSRFPYWFAFWCRSWAVTFLILIFGELFTENLYASRRGAEESCRCLCVNLSNT